MFPEIKLRALIAKITNPRWVVPVLPEQELEVLLNYAIELTKAGKCLLIFVVALNSKERFTENDFPFLICSQVSTKNVSHVCVSIVMVYRFHL